MQQSPWIANTLLGGSPVSTPSPEMMNMILAIHSRQRQIVREFWTNARKALRQRNDELAIKHAPYYDIDSQTWD
jgi:hypothetical protein